MCILIASIEHPKYPFILLSNRDEYFQRPTQRAHWRDLEDGRSILSPLDLARPEHGSWIGVTSDGRVSVLVNYREKNDTNFISEISRGILPIAFLSSTKTCQEWLHTFEGKLSTDLGCTSPLSRIGGFTLLYGKLGIDHETGHIKNLNIISNRGSSDKILDVSENESTGAISKKTTFGLSNSSYDVVWPKVAKGERMLQDLIADASSSLSKEDLVEQCFKILSTDTYDHSLVSLPNIEQQFDSLKNSIFIPPLDVSASKLKLANCIGRYYGTRTQTVLLMDHDGNIDYYEKDLHQDDNPIVSNVTNHFCFNIHKLSTGPHC